MLLTAASLLLRGSSMCFHIFLTQRIGAAGLGLLQLVSSVSILAMTLGSAGVRVAAMYLTAEEYGARRPGGARRALNYCLIYGFVLSVLGGIGLYVSSDYLATHWIMDPRAASSLRGVAFAMPSSCLWAVMAGYFTACSKLKQLVLVEFVDQGIAIVTTVVLMICWVGYDTERACLSIVVGNGIASFLTLFMLLNMVMREKRAPVEENLHMWRRLIKLCVPLAANDALRSGLSTTEQMIIPIRLEKFSGSRENALSSYGVIHGMVFPIMMFPSVLLFSLSDLLVAELAMCRAAKAQNRIEKLTDRCLHMGFLFACAVGGACYCLSDALGQLLFHEAQVGVYLRMFAPMILVLYMDVMVDGMHKGLGQQVFCVRINTITSFLDVLFLWLLLPKYGITGYFFSFSVTHLLNFAWSLGHLVKITGHTPTCGYFIKQTMCTVFAVAATVQLCPTSPHVLFSCGVQLIVYGSCFAVFSMIVGCVTRGDVVWLRAKL